MANVYQPARLHVVDRCKTASGTITFVQRELDGDIHLTLELDPADRGLGVPAAPGRAPELTVEVVPADQPGCTPGQPPQPPSAYRDYGTCTGADVRVPPVGTHVSVTGPYVLDVHHEDGPEIHPAWRIRPT